MLNEITACLQKGFELGVRWTDESGVLNDPYESNRPENFAPACWAVIGASLYRLTGEDVYLEWTDRWMQRTAGIMEGARNSPGFREYVMGYGVMVFPILSDVVERDVLEGWEAAFAASYTDDAGLSDCHVSAASLLCDLFLDSGAGEDCPGAIRRIHCGVQQASHIRGFPARRRREREFCCARLSDRHLPGRHPSQEQIRRRVRIRGRTTP